MSTSSYKPTISVHLALWHLFHIWRAKRMYERVARMEEQAVRLFTRANDLTVKHSLAPLPLFDRLNEE